MERMVPRFDPNLIRGRLTVLTCYQQFKHYTKQFVSSVARGGSV